MEVTRGKHAHEIPASAIESIGALTDCTTKGCHMPLIYDGSKWRWFYEMSQRERRELQGQYYMEKFKR